MSVVLNCVKDAVGNSYNRKMKFPKKITAEICRKEIEISHVIGEVSGAERVLHYIINAKANNTFVVEDLEAELHMFIQTGLSHASKSYYGVEVFKLDDVLRVHGYLKEA